MKNRTVIEGEKTNSDKNRTVRFFRVGCRTSEAKRSPSAQITFFRSDDVCERKPACIIDPLFIMFTVNTIAYMCLFHFSLSVITKDRPIARGRRCGCSRQRWKRYQRPAIGWWYHTIPYPLTQSLRPTHHHQHDCQYRKLASQPHSSPARASSSSDGLPAVGAPSTTADAIQESGRDETPAHATL